MNKNLLLLVFICVVFQYVEAQNEGVTIKESQQAPSIDGVIDPGEWSEASIFVMPNSFNRDVSVYVKYDANYLYVAFTNLINTNGISANPEVLINTNTNSDAWTDSTYWYHVSYSCCSAKGSYYYWDNCTNTPYGWKANVLPFKEGHDNVEIQIAWSALNIASPKEAKMTMALKLSDAKEQHSYWPENADIALPDTWGIPIFN